MPAHASNFLGLFTPVKASGSFPILRSSFPATSLAWRPLLRLSFPPSWTRPTFTRSPPPPPPRASWFLSFQLLSFSRRQSRMHTTCHYFACTSSRFRRDVILLVAFESPYAVPSPGGVPLLAPGLPALSVVLIKAQLPIASFFPSKHGQQSALPKRRSCDSNLVSGCGEKSRPTKGTVYTISNASPSV